MAQIISLSPIFERIPAKERRFKEIIVMVHHYGGNRLSFGRHIDWLNEIGFDVVTFDLPTRSIGEITQALPISKNWSFGLRHIWADKIENVMGHLSEEKILYSFSIPSISALMAMGRRHAIDVKAWVCDGGPFVNIEHGIYNLLGDKKLTPKVIHGFRDSRVRVILARFCALAVGSRNYDRDLRRHLTQLPHAFPVLSMRSEKDHLVTPEMIDHFFVEHLDHLDLRGFNLHRSGHLLGFKQEPDLYKKTVSDFLLDQATFLK